MYTNISIDKEPSLEELLIIFRAISDPTRLRLMGLTSKTELSVSELTQILAQSQPRISRHLKLLCEAGLLERFQEGTSVFYRAENNNSHPDLIKVIDKIITNSDWMSLDFSRLQEAKKNRSKKIEDYFKANASRWDQIRSMHVPELEVENYLLRIISGKKIKKFLDIGTGTGRILELFGKNVDQGWGIDNSKEMIAMARQAIERANLKNCHVRFSDMYSLPFFDKSIDMICIHQVLHFANDPEEAIKESSRVLNIGGTIIVIDFLPHNIESLRQDHAHKRLGFSNFEITKWLESSKLKIVNKKQFSGNPLTVVIWVAEKQ